MRKSLKKEMNSLQSDPSISTQGSSGVESMFFQQRFSNQKRYILRNSSPNSHIPCDPISGAIEALSGKNIIPAIKSSARGFNSNATSRQAVRASHCRLQLKRENSEKDETNSCKQFFPSIGINSACGMSYSQSVNQLLALQPPAQCLLRQASSLINIQPIEAPCGSVLRTSLAESPDIKKSKRRLGDIQGTSRKSQALISSKLTLQKFNSKASTKNLQFQGHQLSLALPSKFKPSQLEDQYSDSVFGHQINSKNRARMVDWMI